MSQEREITWGIREEKGEIKYGQTKYQDQNRKFETAKICMGFSLKTSTGPEMVESIRNDKKQML